MSSITLPNLEERFLPPENWESGSFVNSETNHKIHYSSALIENSKGTVVALPGLSEFGEKYIETARFFNAQGYSFYVIDWAYQGRSSRFLKNPHKRYSDGYQTDISDLNHMMKNIIKDHKNLYMLAHSMGSNIGIRHLFNHPGLFKAAAFSAPMLGIQDIGVFQKPLKVLLYLLPFIREQYVPKGSDWHDQMRPNNVTGIFSSDLEREKIHSIWSKTNPELQVGNVTFKWILESLKSISIIFKYKKTKHLDTPTLFAFAENERLVSNTAIKKFTKNLPNSKTIELKNSKHEILVETDDIRDKFLQEALSLFSQPS